MTGGRAFLTPAWLRSVSANRERLLDAVGPVALYASLAVVAISMLCVLGATADSRRLLFAFDMDENFVVGMVLRSLERGDLAPMSDRDPRAYFFDYGYVYQEIAYAIVRGYQRLGYEPTVYLVTYVLRFVSFASWCALAAAIYWMERRLGLRRFFALGITVIAICLPSAVQAGTVVHPDITQAAFIAAGFCCLLGRYSLLRVLGASIFWGIAFGVKYGGVFALPALAVYVVTGTAATHSSRRRAAVRAAVDLVLSAVLFVATWAVTNPYAARNRRRLVRALTWREHHIGRGHGGRENVNASVWLSALSRELSWVGVAILVLGIAVAAVWMVHRLRRRSGSGRLAPAFFGSPRALFVATLFVFCVTTFVYLFGSVHMIRSRYFLVGLPEWMALAGFGLALLVARVPHGARGGASIVVVVVALGSAAASVRGLAGTANRYVDSRMRLGAWLDDRYGSNTTIAADLKTYIPPRFTVLGTDFVTSKEVTRRPDVIVLSHEGSGRYCWKRPGTDFSTGNLVCTGLEGGEPTCRMYRWLARSGVYSVIREDSSYIVFERTPPA